METLLPAVCGLFWQKACNMLQCMHVQLSPKQSSCNSTREESLVVTNNNKIVVGVLAVHVRSLVGHTSTPHVACAPPTAHTAHRAYSDIAIVKIKLDTQQSDHEQDLRSVAQLVDDPLHESRPRR